MVVCKTIIFMKRIRFLQQIDFRMSVCTSFWMKKDEIRRIENCVSNYYYSGVITLDGIGL